MTGADHLGEVVAVLGADQLEHQVERGDAAGAGEPVAVAQEQLLDHLDLGMALMEQLHGLPVQRDSVAVEQAGGGQREGAGVDGTQGVPCRSRRRSQASSPRVRC